MNKTNVHTAVGCGSAEKLLNPEYLIFDDNTHTVWLQWPGQEPVQ